VKHAFATLLIFLSTVLTMSAADASGSGTNKPAGLKIAGYGVLGNRELKRILRTMELSGTKPHLFAPAFVEDSALILISRIKRDGYLRPNLRVLVFLKDGEVIKRSAEELLDEPLDRSLQITRVEFYIEKGKLYHYREIRFEGLELLREKEAQSYFMETATLLHPKSARVYTPENLKRGLGNLTDLLDRHGYRDATAAVAELRQDDHTGAVWVRIQVNQGIKSMVRSLQEAFYFEDETEPREVRVVFPNHALSRVWSQDLNLSLKTNLYHQGYPDTTVALSTLTTNQSSNRIYLDLKADVKSGPKVYAGKVHFSGQKYSSADVLGRRVRIKRGEELDRIRVEEGRYRLAQLGAFDSVDLVYEPREEHVRDLLYRVQEGKRLEVSLLVGYGSYEMLRGGVEIEENNIWGRGHRARLKAIQSFKASSGDFTYTVPEFAATDVDLFVNGFGLRREEVSFTRREYGGGVGGHEFFKDYATDLMIRYSYQILNAAEVPGIVAAEGTTNTPVGAIIWDVKHDRRDNPLYPHHGYRVFANLELASEYLGGDANYQRFETWASWHHPIGGGRYISFGVSHGFVSTIGSTAKDLPFNRRFFPGGENSIRGYGEGEASPRDANGKLIGAESYILGSIELEQSLTKHWSLVAFSDSIGIATHIANYPADTGLYSIGGGVRWRTIIGPVRFEYGHNLNPRPHDPDGTFQFSLGYPF
jgi:outer membrane protein insertion porin family